jgi:hypothetical protein
VKGWGDLRATPRCDSYRHFEPTGRRLRPSRKCRRQAVTGSENCTVLRDLLPTFRSQCEVGVGSKAAVAVRPRHVRSPFNSGVIADLAVLRPRVNERPRSMLGTLKRD